MALIDAGLRGIDKRQSYAIRMYLRGTKGKLIAKKLGISKERVYAIIKQGLHNLNKAIKVRKDYQTERYKDRSSTKLKRWRFLVLERDRYTCYECGSRDYPEAHHIKSFKHYPELRFEVNNGKTLCRKCHRNIDI